MDDILEKIARHRNMLVGVFAGAAGVFALSLIMSGDWGVVAQALGSLVGAAIGAVGAAGAVVWQMGKQDRQRTLELNELRGAAFHHVLTDLAERLFLASEAASDLLEGRSKEAADRISKAAIGAFTIDRELLTALKEKSPRDILAKESLVSTYHELWQLSARIARAKTPKNEQDRYALSQGITVFASFSIRFLGEQCQFLKDVDAFRNNFDDIRKTLDPMRKGDSSMSVDWRDWRK